MSNLELLDLLGEIQALAKRAEFPLSEFLADYGFAKSPTLQKALDYSSGKDNTIEREQSFLWCTEYDRIFVLIEIAYDYIEKLLKLTNTVIY